jgi:thioredoxin 1
MQIVNDENFNQEVNESKTPVLVYFGATWCGPCSRQAPVLEEWATERTDVKLVKVDVDESPQTAREYGIRSIPAIVFIKDGMRLGSKTGLTSKDKINELVG